jgi:hypothetical protein
MTTEPPHRPTFVKVLTIACASAALAGLILFLLLAIGIGGNLGWYWSDQTLLAILGLWGFGTLGLVSVEAALLLRAAKDSGVLTILALVFGLVTVAGLVTFPVALALDTYEFAYDSGRLIPWTVVTLTGLGMAGMIVVCFAAAACRLLRHCKRSTRQPTVREENP